MADIPDTLIDDGRFATLVTAINQASLMQGLMEPASVTLFAPTDTAFSKLPSGTVNFLLNNPPELTRLLTYHISTDRISADDIGQLDTVQTVEGSTLEVRTSNGVCINDARVTEADITADNGVIHVIDTVLIPESLGQMFIAR